MSAKSKVAPKKAKEPEVPPPDEDEVAVDDVPEADPAEDAMDVAESAADDKKRVIPVINGWEASMANVKFSHSSETGSIVYHYKYKDQSYTAIDLVMPPGYVVYQSTAGFGYKHEKKEGEKSDKDSEWKSSVTVANIPILEKIDRKLQAGTKKLSPFNTHDAWNATLEFLTKFRTAALNYVKSNKECEKKFKAAQKKAAETAITTSITEGNLKINVKTEEGKKARDDAIQARYRENVSSKWHFPLTPDMEESEKSHTWANEEPSQDTIYHLKASTRTFLEMSEKQKKFFKKLDPRVIAELEKDPKDEDMLFIKAELEKGRAYRPLDWYDTDNSPQNRPLMAARTSIGSTISLRFRLSSFQFQSNAGMSFILLPSLNMSEAPEQAFKKEDFKSDFAGVEDEADEDEAEADAERRKEEGEEQGDPDNPFANADDDDQLSAHAVQEKVAAKKKKVVHDE